VNAEITGGIAHVDGVPRTRASIHRATQKRNAPGKWV
jgi:hypothetical protein